MPDVNKNRTPRLKERQGEEMEERAEERREREGHLEELVQRKKERSI